MKLSVIIPVYNAEKYIRNAVQSALKQAETFEVLLVEDCSPDNSLNICQELEQKYEKVKLLRHPGGINLGAGASRNLGIKNASSDFIGFLDADDYYLNDRFTNASKLLKEYPQIDGVYEATGVHYYDEQSRKKWLAMGGNNLTTLKQKVAPNRLFNYLLTGKGGHLHLDGIVVRKDLIKKCGFFFEHLKLHQDTALIYQMSIMGSLYPGNLHSPVACRTIHSSNRILSKYDRHYAKYLLFESLFSWAADQRLDHSKLVILYLRFIYNLTKLTVKRNRNGHGNEMSYKSILFSISKHPYLFLHAMAIYSIERFKLTTKRVI